VVATNVSQQTLALAAERAASRRLDNIEFVRMDAEALRFEDGSFDAATNTFGLMFCSDPLRALLEAYRVLAPGGRIAIATWDEPSKSPFFTVMRDTAATFLALPRIKACPPSICGWRPIAPRRHVAARLGSQIVGCLAHVAARSSVPLATALIMILTFPFLLITGASRAASLPTHARKAHRDCAERVHVRFVFGLRRPGGPVSETEWMAFLSEVLTPRFPNGLTIIEASVQWRGTGDRSEREPSRIVEIVQDELPDVNHRIGEVVTTYKNRYQQESVMVTRARLEACF
jgi:SAM-dependent methyltransferase